MKKIIFEENSFFADELDLNNSICVSNNSVQKEATSGASDITNQIAILCKKLILLKIKISIF